MSDKIFNLHTYENLVKLKNIHMSMEILTIMASGIIFTARAKILCARHLQNGMACWVIPMNHMIRSVLAWGNIT